MPPPLDHPSLNLQLLDEIYVVQKLRSNEAVPENVLKFFAADTDKSLVSITKTSEEISIVSSLTINPNEGLPRWRCIKIEGPMDFGLTGVLCDFTNPLKRAGIPVFAVSTWNTDYILVPEAKAPEAADALKKDGWKFNDGKL